MSIEKNIVEDYLTGKGINNLRLKYNISQARVYEILKDNNVKIRGRGSVRVEFYGEKLKELIYLYSEEKWSLKDLEKRFNSSKENIKKTLEKNNVTLRLNNKTIYAEGTVFNNYTYLYELKERRNGKIYWKVSCVCGVKKELNKWDVISGKVKHCGCQHKKGDGIRNKDRENLLANNVYKEYEKSARVKNLEFSISFDEFKKLVKKNCYYCGEFNFKTRKDEYTKHVYKYIGIDRKNNNKGYIYKNVVPCCFTCNRMKSAQDYNDFLRRISDIYHNLIDK